MLRRLRYPLFLVVAFLVLFEGALQVTACTLWAIQPDLAKVEGDRPVVLCIGDSFTHGMGATRHELAYPGQLETALEGRATVVNGGMVAQSSADVLKRLQGQIDRFHPAVVCVLCGINDLGWPTTRVPPEEEAPPRNEAEGFSWEWRTRRVVIGVQQWLSGGPDYGRQKGATPDFVGTWHTATHEIRIEASGRMVLRAFTLGQSFIGWITMYWRLEDETLMVRLMQQQGFVELPADWQLEGERLELTLPGFPLFAFTRGARQPTNDLERGVQCADQDDHAAAIPLFEKAVLDPALEVAARSGLVTSLRATGQDDAARAQATRVVARYEQGDKAVASAALRVLMAAGQHEAALRLGVAMHAAGVDALDEVLLYQVSLDAAGHGALQAATAKVLEDRGLAPVLRGRLLRLRFQAVRDADPEAALRILVEAELTANNPVFTVSNIHRSNFSDADIDACLDAVGATDEQRAHIRKIRDGVRKGAAKNLDTVSYHLHRIVARCRENGAKPVLITYPLQTAHHETMVRAVARETDAPLVVLRAHFETLLESERWEDLFVADGHCGDRGYGEMAHLIAETVGPLLP